MSDSAFQIKYLSPADLPEDPIALDAWILEGKEVILSKDRVADDQLISSEFDEMKDIVQQNFNQPIEIEKQPFHQCLVLENKLLKFVRMDTQKTYLAQTNPPLTQVSTILERIIAQELDFRKQLTTFQIMLQTADVLKSPVKLISNDTLQQQTIASESELKPTGHSLLKRSILDIFTPYSLNTVGDTANDNYRIMNRNFHDVHDTELKLSHQQTVLFESLDEMTTQQLEIAQKELYLELRSLKTRYFQDFLFSLEQILQNNRLDSAYEIIFELLRTHQFCNSDTCLTAPIFTVISDSKIQITVQKALQSLAKAVFISCTVLQNDRTSIFSH